MRMRRGAVAAALAMLAAAVMPAAVSQAATPRAGIIPVPRGYFVASTDELVPGVTHVQLISLSPARVVNVALVRKTAAARLQVVVSNERIAGGTETVRSMCARVQCLLGVNGDFFSTATGQPGGGIASLGALLRTPPATRWNVTRDAGGTAGVQHVATTVRFFGHRGATVVPVYVSGVNVARDANRIALYTDRWAPTTQTGSGFEITLQPADEGAEVRFGQTLRVTMVAGFAAGSTPVPKGGFVLSASGTLAPVLASLWHDVLAGTASAQAEITAAVTPNVETFAGGAPVLLRDGRQAFTDNLSTLYARPWARTLAGRTAAGDLILATVDARSPLTGMRMIDAMRFIRSLGAVDALNLDGGGSTTFVKRGWLVDTPSDGHERGVSEALAVVAG